MSKGLGKLQRHILKNLYEYEQYTIRELYREISFTYWGDWLGETYQWKECRLIDYKDEDEKKELNKRRASIAQALRSLKSKSLISTWDFVGIVNITEQGKAEYRRLGLNIN